jgi:uncharacterized membrane protein
VEVSGTLAVGEWWYRAVCLLLVVYLGKIMLERYPVASAADIVAAIGATFVTNATNATNATNTVNVGVTNDAATTPVFFILGSAEINTKFQVLIYLCSFYWYFISNRFSSELLH